ncbi:hypothetical protein VDG1235_3853 [Verrucomicrobiia bacterium DG1235]|nr:hypothetical protein VDG1235_3853 [Verrucomicrobiae bacterium DG1235]
MATETGVCLTWEAPDTEFVDIGYFVYRDGVEVGMTTETSFFDYGLSLDGIYHYTVMAFDHLGRVSAPSNIQEIATPGTLLPSINVIQNGGFEDGVASWERLRLQAYVSGEDPMEGIRCGRMFFPAGPTTAKISQSNLVLEQDTEYMLFFFVRSNRVANNELVVNMTSSSYAGLVGVPSTVPYTIGLDHVPVAVTKDWQPYCLSFRMPPAFGDAFNVTLSFQFKDGTGLLGYYSLDHVFLAKKGDVERLTYRP